MEPRVTFLAVTLVGVAFLAVVTGYPNNVPSSPDICSKMTPGHGPRPQQSRPPYKIVLNKQEMQGGNNLQIIIEGKKGQKFKGFYLQVRDQDGLPIGTFLIPDEKEVGAHNCFNQKNNAVHHKSNIDKDSVTVYWKAPESYNGKVKIQATVLKDFETYWIDVRPSDLVSVSTTTSHFFPSSSDSLEKRKTDSTKSSKKTRILNYNPYSPFSPLSSSWDDSHNASTSAEQPQASEDAAVTARERQLFGFPSFDFHDSLYSPKLSSAKKPKNIHLVRPDYPKLPFNEQGDHLPLFRPAKKVLSHSNTPLPTGPTGSLSFSKLGGIKEKHAGYFHNPKSSQPFGYPPVDSPYHYHSSSAPSLHEPHHTAPLFSAHPYDKPVYTQPPPPHYSQSIINDKGGHHYINHHYLHNPAIKPGYAKPPVDPTYPNSGYFPKDILTKLTSYIPNIYNALTNNPLFNFNIDNTIESIWKPVKGVPTKLDPSVSATTTQMQMPKYGYLVYNPVRKNPYFVIPAENEDEFMAHHHLGRMKDTFSYS